MSNAGTNANVFIVIYGTELNTGECVLAETKKKKKGCFERGSSDQFVKEVGKTNQYIFVSCLLRLMSQLLAEKKRTYHHLQATVNRVFKTINFYKFFFLEIKKI